jgi:hypothetical protein
MGYITRRLTYLVATRRFSLPAPFLSAHGLEHGALLRVAAPAPGERMVFTAAQWAMLEATLRRVPPSAELARLLETGEQVTLGSQARVVLPRGLAFSAQEERLELTWQIDEGVLLVTAQDAQEPATIAGQPPDARSATPALEPAVASGAGDRSSSSPLERRAVAAELTPAGDGAPHPAAQPRTESPGRSSIASQPLLPEGLVLPGPVQQIPLGDIHGFDPSIDPEHCPEDLAEDIASQGILHPVVLAGPVPHRVVDGRKRLLVAQSIKLEAVPAVVFSALGRDDLARIRYLLETTSDRWAVARQLRVMARLHANGASIDELARLLRKKRRTVQRYLRIAQDPRLVDAIERGDLSLLEAERKAGRTAA